jgi:hypothetical protein
MSGHERTPSAIARAGFGPIRRTNRARTVGTVALIMAVGVLVSAVLLWGQPAVESGSPSAARGEAPPRALEAAITVPTTPVGQQLDWLLGTTTQLPLSDSEISAHFDQAFLAQVAPTELNSALAGLGPPGPMTLLAVLKTEPTSLEGTVAIGSAHYSVLLSVDPAGLIDGLVFRSAAQSLTTWSAVDRQISAVAPRVSFLAARVQANGTCATVNSISARTPRPLGSMFKLFVLGALANEIRDHRLSWNQKVTVTGAVKVGGSGTLQNDPDGTTLNVEQAAIKMISVSDNTAADLLLSLVDRAAVEHQVELWSSHPSLDIPFLTVSELFALKYDDFPKVADHFLSLSPSGRAAYLRSTIDSVPVSAEVAVSSPRDVDTIEWFASPDDLCRAFVGLRSLRAERGLGPIGTVLSVNNGGIDLSASLWPTVWFKGGSEPGVLTLGYLAQDNRGQTFVVVVMIDNPTNAFNEQATALQLLSVVAGAFDLLR